MLESAVSRHYCNAAGCIGVGILSLISPFRTPLLTPFRVSLRPFARLVSHSYANKTTLSANNLYVCVFSLRYRFLFALPRPQSPL